MGHDVRIFGCGAVISLTGGVESWDVRGLCTVSHGVGEGGEGEGLLLSAETVGVGGAKGGVEGVTVGGAMSAATEGRRESASALPWRAPSRCVISQS